MCRPLGMRKRSTCGLMFWDDLALALSQATSISMSKWPISKKKRHLALASPMLDLLGVRFPNVRNMVIDMLVTQKGLRCTYCIRWRRSSFVRSARLSGCPCSLLS